MKPPPFDYHRAQSIADAMAVLAGQPDAKILAGGQSLVPLMNLRLVHPAVLVDINPLTELDYVTLDEDGTTRVGALCRHSRLESDPQILKHQPLLSHAARHVAHPQVRARGTLGGSLAHADPAAELPAALVALDARVKVAGPAGRARETSVKDLVTGFLATTLEPEEMLVEIVIPARPPQARAAFREIAPRHGDFATAGVAVELSFDRAGRCGHAVAAGCGLSALPVDLSAAVQPLAGQATVTEYVLREVAVNASRAFDPSEDLHASAQDRRELAAALLVEAIRAAWHNGGAADEEAT
ncbi:MAG: xanthine dehydrogenase family protein subunit M [Streptosporangiaceae bacterium]|nr:xanthine dehydrogenase family protein subunit M [Streptosporangiaceae bacterium]